MAINAPNRRALRALLVAGSIFHQKASFLSRALAIRTGESRRFVQIKKPTRPYADGGSLQGANLHVTAQKQAKKNIKSRPGLPQCRQECPAAGLETAHQNPHIVVVVLDDLRPDNARSFF
jgi:hypothetical protein